MFSQIVSALDHQTPGVDKPAALPGLLFGETFLHQGGDDQVRNADAGFARPQEKKPLIR